MPLKIARYLHLEDRFARLTSEENDFTAMLRRNAISKGKAKTSALLFSFAHERLKEALANLLWNTSAIVDHIYDNQLLADFHG